MMVDEDELLKLEEASRPRRKGSRRGLTVRMLAAKTEWLEGLIVWHEDRVWWQTGGQTVHPEPADLAQTERTLNRVRRYPRSTDLTFGDGEAWLERRFELLAIAKQLSALRCKSLAELVRKAKEREPDSIESLIGLIRAEAHCANGLSPSPVSELAELGKPAAALIERLACSPKETEETRALAALVLGALSRRGDDSPRFATERQRRAWQWGRAQGITEHPALISRLLAAAEGRDLAHRCLAAVAPHHPLRLPAETLRVWLDTGSDEETVVRLAEAFSEATPLVERLENWRPLLPATPARKRLEMAESFEQIAVQSRERVYEALVRVAAATRSPEAVANAVDLLLWLLPGTTPTLEWVDAALEPVKCANRLPRETAAAWLEIVARRRSALWPGHRRAVESSNEPLETKPARLLQFWRTHGLGLYAFIAQTGDPKLVEEALEFGNPSMLLHMRGDAPEVYRSTFSIARRLEAKHHSHAVRVVQNLVKSFSSPAEAQTALRPLLAALDHAPERMRASLLTSLLDYATRPINRPQLTRLADYARLAVPYAADPDHPEFAHTLTYVLVGLDECLGERTVGIAGDVVTRYVGMVEQNPDLRNESWRLTSGLEVACGLREPDEDPPFPLVETFIHHDVPSWKSGRDAGLKLLVDLPALRRTLRTAFATQPHRCIALIDKLGLTGRLGAEARAPLLALDDEPAPLASSSGWDDVLRLAPDLEVDARAFVRNRLLLGEATDPPPGVVRVLKRSHKLAGELAYLEDRIADADDPALRARCESLRAQLVHMSASEGALAAEVRDHFQNIAVEATLQAAEKLIGECYGCSLERLLGPMARSIERDEDWLNVALLSTSLETNKKLLKRMVRAEAEGLSGWREAHPSNAQFLKGLADRGVNSAVWLSLRPRTFASKRASGKKVRLHLEQRPLRILQMGNYFDTCLSSDGCNAFSTVANACELNKRVVYATDARGRVIGRKLIGLNENGDLIGYALYSTDGTQVGRKELNTIFRRYLTEFAADCHLTLANEGTVPRLFAQAWYDDGRVDWDDEEASPGKGQAHASRAAPMLARFSSRSRP